MISYDENKRLANIAKHGIDFAIAEEVFAGFTVSREDNRADYGEIRLQTLGLWQGVVVVMIIHTPRDDSDHIISIRKAEKHESKYYFKHYNAL